MSANGTTQTPAAGEKAHKSQAAYKSNRWYGDKSNFDILEEQHLPENVKKACIDIMNKFSPRFYVWCFATPFGGWGSREGWSIRADVQMDMTPSFDDLDLVFSIAHKLGLKIGECSQDYNGGFDMALILYGTVIDGRLVSSDYPSYQFRNSRVAYIIRKWDEEHTPKIEVMLSNACFRGKHEECVTRARSTPKSVGCDCPHHKGGLN